MCYYAVFSGLAIVKVSTLIGDFSIFQDSSSLKALMMPRGFDVVAGSRLVPYNRVKACGSKKLKHEPDQKWKGSVIPAFRHQVQRPRHQNQWMRFAWR